MYLSYASLNKRVIEYLLSHETAFGLLHITAHRLRCIDNPFSTPCSPNADAKSGQGQFPRSLGSEHVRSQETQGRPAQPDETTDRNLATLKEQLPVDHTEWGFAFVVFNHGSCG